MGIGEQVVARFNDGKVIKGYAKAFSAESSILHLHEEQSGKEIHIPIADLKALFFIKSFRGDHEYREKKAFGISPHSGRKIYIKFNDSESMLGFIEGEIPWSKGFFLSRQRSNAKGFFMIPADGESNNEKVFVVGSSIKDVTVVVK